MAGADFSAFQVLWFMIAGFILGFATSTLWEWLYYRGKHRAQAEATSLVVSPPTRADNQISQPDTALPIQADESWAMSYRGPGIYLESEQPSAAEQRSSPLDTLANTSSPTSSVSVDEEEEADSSLDGAPLHAPRINPATLAALQSAVAQSPIAHSAAQTRIYDTLPAQGTTAPTLFVGAAPSYASPHQQNDEQRDEQNEDEVHVREISSYDALSADARLEAEGEAIEADVSDVKVVEILQVARTAPNASRTQRVTDHPDDLALIKGVGEAYKRRLYHAGVYTWRQVAESDTESLRHITRAKPNANIGDWHAQAQELAEKYQRWNTTFQGPLDDFTRIDGIGAITADILYKAGLCTYEQLAAALPDELAKIVPAPTVGDEMDFDGWINTAVQLANTKRHNQGARV